MRQCKVFVKGIEAGILKETDDRKYIFTYHEDYVDRYKHLPVSLTMPVRKEPYHSDHLFPYFFSILSEGANRQTQSVMLHIDEHDDFGILLATARQDTIGAVTIKQI